MDLPRDVVFQVFRVEQHLEHDHLDDVSDPFVPPVEHSVTCTKGGVKLLKLVKIISKSI